jgi:hypothetical protein
MSDVIDFLEKLGQDSTLRHASRSQLAAALSSAGFSSQLQAALMGADQGAVAGILGADTNVCCMVNAPLQEEEEKAPHEPRKLESLLGSGNVCCMVYAPLEEQEEPQPERVAA